MGSLYGKPYKTEYSRKGGLDFICAGPDHNFQKVYKNYIFAFHLRRYSFVIEFIREWKKGEGGPRQKSTDDLLPLRG